MRRGSKKNRLLDRWFGIPLVNLLASARPRRAMPTRVARVGLMCSPALGDTLLFSGVLRDLRRHFDHAARRGTEGVEIVHFCMKENLPAAELIQGSDRRCLIDLLRPEDGVPMMRAQHLDLMVDFTPWQRVSALHTLMSGARFTAGFQSAGQFRARAFDLAVEHRNDRHELENFRALVRALGVETGCEPEVAVPDQDDSGWRDLWRSSIQAGERIDLNGSERLVVLHPWPAGVRSTLREWPEGRWLEFAQSLARRFSETVFVLTGGPADRARVEALTRRLNQAGLRSVGFSAAGGLGGVVALLRRAHLAVCVNTGIMHLAAIVGTPTVGLNGPTADLRWGPRGRCSRAIAPVDGSGGYLHFGYEYPPNPEDVMSRIPVDAVYAAALELMECGAVQ